MEERKRLYEEKKAARQKKREEKETAKRKDEEIKNYRLLNATIPEQDRRLTKAASEKAKSVSTSNLVFQIGSKYFCIFLSSIAFN